VCPLEAVHLVPLVLPQGIIVTGFHIIVGSAPGGRPGLYRLTLGKEVQELADGDHLDLGGSFTIRQKRSMLPG